MSKKRNHRILKIWNIPLCSDSAESLENPNTPLTWSELISLLVGIYFIKYLLFDVDRGYSLGFSLNGIIMISCLIFCLFFVIGLSNMIINNTFLLLNNVILSKNKTVVIKKEVKTITKRIVNETLFDGEKRADGISKWANYLNALYTAWFFLIFLIVPLGLWFENTLLFKFLWIPFQVLNTIWLIYFSYVIFSTKVYRNLFFFTVLIICLILLMF